MSVLILLPICGAGTLTPAASVPLPGRLWKPLRLVSAPSPQLPWRRCVLERVRRRDSLGVTASAAPCERLEGSAPSVGFAGVAGVAFESSALQERRDDLVFAEGRSPELIRATAYLRALCFYTYPEGRTEYAVKLHRKMKADDEFSALTSKVAGLEQGYKRISCILALYPVAHLADSPINLHTALKVMLANGEEHVLVGSLDLNQGLRLPGEITGNKPEVGSPFPARKPSLYLSAPSRTSQGPDAERKRGYLSNVCVAPQVRQRGVGAALLQRAQNVAQLWGVSNLYVHVVATNEAAVKLYTKCGFTFEKEERAAEARLLARPRRLLLHKCI